MALGGLQKSRNWAGPGRGSQDGCRLGTAKAPVLIWGRSPPQGAGTNTQPATHPASHPPSHPPNYPLTQPASHPVPSHPATKPPTQSATQSPTQPLSYPPSYPATYPAIQLSTQPASQPPSQPATQPASHPPSNHAATRGTYLTHKTHQPTSPPAYDHSNTGHRSSLPADTGLRCPRTLGCPTWPAGQLAPGGRWSAGGSRWGAPVPPGQAYSLWPSLTHPDPAPSKP